MCRNLNIILQIRGDSEWFAINVVSEWFAINVVDY